MDGESPANHEDNDADDVEPVIVDEDFVLTFIDLELEPHSFSTLFIVEEL